MRLSVTDPIGLALRRTGLLLFQPFRLSKWLALSLGAWLWLMGEGVGGNFNFNGSSGGGRGGGGGPPPDIGKLLRDGWDWVHGNLGWLIPVIAVGFISLLTIYLLVRWLACRGTFMFIDNIVRNDSRVKAPWAEFRELGNSLFKFRVCWDALWVIAWLLLLAIGGILVWTDLHNYIVTNTYTLTGWTIAAIAWVLVGSLVLAVAGWILGSVVFRIGVPVMYIRGMQAWPAMKTAWRELFVPNLGACLLYFLFLIVVVLARALWGTLGLLLLGVVTCCIALILSILPLVGLFIIVLVSLPVLVFDRAYTLHFVAQFGPAYAIVWQVPSNGGFPVILNNSPTDSAGPSL